MENEPRNLRKVSEYELKNLPKVSLISLDSVK